MSPSNWAATQVAADAFHERQALPPIWGGRAVPSSSWAEVWQTEIACPLDTDALAYLHIPFCANHCVFCGFYRNAWQEDYSRIYVDKVIAELTDEALQRHGSGKIRAVYFGGGTPTALQPADLARLIEACHRTLPLADDCEFTLEGRIRHFPPEKAKTAIAAGVNRISIGVQTFDTAIRRKLGRKYSGKEVRGYLEKLAALDVVLVADLMFGLPGQDDAVWARDLATAAALPLAGLDTYAFNRFPHLPINRMIEKGKFPEPPPLAIQAHHYAQAVAALLAAGWQQVSNSHFAFPGRGERNRYNTLVKSGMPCLAFGSGAGGSLHGFSYQVQGNLQNYLAAPSAQKNLDFVSRHGAYKALLSRVQHDIELGRINTRLFADNPAATALLREWQQRRLLAIGADHTANLHTSGRFWAPTMTRRLMLTLPPEQEPT